MRGTCKHPGCVAPHSCKGYCSNHYNRWRRGTDMDAPLRIRAATEHERFWEKVVKTPACWEWTGAKFRGYGVFRSQGKNCLAHRFSFMEANGEIPNGMEVDHMCFNKGCVNPEHLRLLTHSENGQNRSSADRDSKSGIRGVYKPTGSKSWVARATKDRKPHHIGNFKTKEEAEKSAVAWRAEHMPASILDRKKVA